MITDSDLRPRILASARLCFCTAAYDEVEMQDVAWGASVPMADVLGQFGAKPQLFAAVIDDCVGSVLGGWSDAAALALLLRSLADPVAAAVASARMRRSGLGSLGTHHLQTAARMLGGASTARKGNPVP